MVDVRCVCRKNGHLPTQGGAMGSLSDADTAGLVARVRGGDQEAWTVLTDAYTGMLWSVARGMRLSDAGAADPALFAGRLGEHFGHRCRAGRSPAARGARCGRLAGLPDAHPPLPATV